jgi:DNA polymerase (family 10)
VLLEPGLQVDLRSVPAPSFGAAMVYFTGSKAHNIAIRRMGQERGLKINEYGVFREALCIGGESEESVYATIDLPWIAPELREDKGEIEAAQRHQLPELVTTADVQGELHARVGTAAAAQEMLRAAQKQGLHYVALVLDARDASRFDSAGAAREIEMMHRLQADASRLRVLTGIEVGIGQNGELMLSEEILQPFDVVIASAYEGWSLSYEEQTQRLLTAMATQRIAILAQPAGPADAAFDFDFSAVARKATERGVGLEISLHPERIAPTETALDIAKREGARFVVSCEAAEASGLDVLHFSVGYARRAGIERHMVLNTSGMSSLEPWLQTHRMETHARQHQRYL